MKRWFASLPVHRKIVAIVLAVSTVAVGAAVIGLLAFDVARFRASAIDDARALARIIARNSAGAIVFDDADAARQILASVEVRPSVSRACVYAVDGRLLATYEQSPAFRCPAVPVEQRGWRTVAVMVPVSSLSDHVVGTVYIERRLTDLPGRIIITGAAALVMLLVAAAVAFALASRMQQLISRPIVSLANAARSIGRDRFEIPDINAAPDETGELVGAFREMVQRLVTANEALKAEVDERARMQAEREQLLSREREASRLKDEFLAALSHELRTPLNAILGWAQILETTDPTEQTIAKAIASVGRNARAQSRVIEDLLDISRIVTGKLPLKLTAADVRTILQAAADVITPAADAKQIRLDVSVPASPCVVQADVDRLRQVFWNLLSNAVKFTPAGGLVKATLVEGDDSFTVTITDTGIGIPAVFLPHVFERFRQADGSTTREHGGLGLGLAIVKELTELHSGSVRAMSDGAGQGASFVVSLPRLIGSVADSESAPSAAIAAGARLEGVDIVAIDDNEDALDILTSALTGAGAQVRPFTSAADAVNAIGRARPDIVLCDIAMPGMDGFEVLSRIRGADATAGGMTPVIAVTAYASAEDHARCLRAGFQAHIAKPYDTIALIQQIAETLARV
jgi:signal transduction histidine kinase/CheY-like chemotaxis protein